jgi:Zn-dependent protease/CBS domain-containing protein
LTGKKIPLFTLLGFKVEIDVTWFILAILIVWSLAKGLFPYYFKNLSETSYWLMAIAGAIGLFTSIIFHEFCHSIVARHYGLPMKGITLFIFGGIAEMTQEPQSPKVEFLMAAAGPLSSILLSATFFAVYFVGKISGLPTTVNGVLAYLGWLNLILAAFNLIPAFPLDGGRILRSALWAAKKNLRWATKIASAFGNGFGIILIVLGIFSFINQNFIGGLWYILIGFFIRNASQMSYKQMLITHALTGEPVEKFMKKDAVTVPADISIRELVDNFFYKYHYKMFPVLKNDKLQGYVSTKQIKSLPTDQWQQHHVDEITDKPNDENTISSDTDSTKALAIMNKTGNSRLMVVDNGILKGIVTLKDMLKFLSLKLDLEDHEKFNIAGQS